MPLRAGDLRERVTFLARGVDENGDRLAAYAELFTRWARVRALRGTEPVIQSRLQGVQPVEITVRADGDTKTVTTANRVRWNGVDHDIQSVAPMEDRSGLVMLAQAAGA